MRIHIATLYHLAKYHEKIPATNVTKTDVKTSVNEKLGVDS